jgi:hypothetical protein
MDTHHSGFLVLEVKCLVAEPNGDVTGGRLPFVGLNIEVLERRLP